MTSGFDIFQTEAPLLIRPMLHRMTSSEIHAVMVGGFATVSGSILASYILYGVRSNGARFPSLEHVHVYLLWPNRYLLTTS